VDQTQADGKVAFSRPHKKQSNTKEHNIYYAHYYYLKVIVVLTGTEVLPGGGNDGGIESSIARHGHSNGNDPANGT